jgi:hypothetical protein
MPVNESIRVQVLEVLAARAGSLMQSLSPEDANALAQLAIRALQITFETEDLEFSAFLHGSDPSGEEYSHTSVVRVQQRPG